MIGLLVTRLTLISAIFIFCWLGTLRPRKWHLLALGTCAAVYFMLVYRDTQPAERMEENAEKITRDLPMGTRVVATIFEPPDYRMVRCTWSTGPASGIASSIRIRGVDEAVPLAGEGRKPCGSGFAGRRRRLQSGLYEVRGDDLPLKEIYQCDAKDWTKLCVRDLKAGGEKRDRRDQAGVRPCGRQIGSFTRPISDRIRLG